MIKFFGFFQIAVAVIIPGKIIDDLKYQYKMAVPVGFSSGKQTGPVIRINFSAAFQTDRTERAVKFLQTGFVVCSVCRFTA